MNFLKSFFKRKDKPIESYEGFWNWFTTNEKSFYKTVKENRSIEKEFFNKISPKLDQLKDGIFYLTGMYDDNTVELVLTSDGAIKNIVFIEELVLSAPAIPAWRFTALKPALDIKDVSIEMSGYKFSSENLSFYSNDDIAHPDEIDITIAHNDLNEKNRSTITNGTYIFLDNYLGELNFATTIDNLNITGKADAKKELMPIEKLKDFLKWRQTEFIEKYEGIKHNTENDNYSILEAKLKSGKALIAVINTDLLNWDSKASHPWILSVEIKYDGKNNNGMPDNNTFQLLDEIEKNILAELKHFEGYLYIGRQTSGNVREVYFACRDFRKPSKVLHLIKKNYHSQIDINYDIYKDKYWQLFDRFS